MSARPSPPGGLVIMIVDRSEPVNLCALLPQPYATLEPQLQDLDHLLDDDALVQQVKAELAKRYPPRLTKGRLELPRFGGSCTLLVNGVRADPKERVVRELTLRLRRRAPAV